MDYCKKLPILKKGQANSIQKLSQKFVIEFNDRSSVRLPEIERRLQFVRELGDWAQSHVEQRNGNRARPTLKGYIIDAASFYVDIFGGHPGRDPNSPCARFVRSATTPVITGTGGDLKSIENVIRSAVWGKMTRAAAGTATAVGVAGGGGGVMEGSDKFFSSGVVIPLTD
jgi:hypothetical protein